MTCRSGRAAPAIPYRQAKPAEKAQYESRRLRNKRGRKTVNGPRRGNVHVLGDHFPVIRGAPRQTQAVRIEGEGRAAQVAGDLRGGGGTGVQVHIERGVVIASRPVQIVAGAGQGDVGRAVGRPTVGAYCRRGGHESESPYRHAISRGIGRGDTTRVGRLVAAVRSEEHTSE